MRDISTKSDGSSSLGAGEFNSSQVELERAVLAAGLSLDAPTGPDNDLSQLAKSIEHHVLAGQSYQDGGSANSYVLTAVQSDIEQPTAYVDGMKVTFKAGATNTGASQINVENIGFVNFRKAGGSSHTAGQIAAGNIITAQFFANTNRFEEVSNTTPEISGPASPDQVAVYTDAGSESGFALTIVSPYIAPSAFTNQMVVFFKANVANNGTNTHPCSIAGLGSKDVKEKNNTDPKRDRIKAGDWVMLVFNELIDALEIAFVYSNPTPAQIIPCTPGSSSGSLFILNSVPGGLPIDSYTDGMIIAFRAPTANTGNLDFNLDGLGQRSVRESITGAEFKAGEVASRAFVLAQFVASEDRWRAFSGTPPIDPLTRNVGARVVGTQQSLVAAGNDLTLSWPNAPASDPLGFYSAGNDRFQVPSGVQAIDVVFSLEGLANSADDGASITGFIRVNGVTVASQTTAFVSGVENLNLVAIEIPVSAGQAVTAVVNQTAGTTYSITGNSSMTIRAARLSA